MVKGRVEGWEGGIVELKRSMKGKEGKEGKKGGGKSKGRNV